MALKTCTHESLTLSFFFGIRPEEIPGQVNKDLRPGRCTMNLRPYTGHRAAVYMTSIHGVPALCPALLRAPYMHNPLTPQHILQVGFALPPISQEETEAQEISSLRTEPLQVPAPRGTRAARATEPG